MDPFSLNNLGTIRQQEILEQAAQGRKGERLWRWELNGLRLVRRLNADGVILEDAPTPNQPRRTFSLRRWLRGLAAQPGSAQPMQDAQCAPEC